MKKHLETNKGSISYLDKNPDVEFTVLFIHGHLTNKSFFKHQVDASVFSEYRLIAIDLPGYGDSRAKEDSVFSFPGFADAVSEFIKLLKIKRLVIVGWSLGGHVALELTLRVPQIEGLVITGTPPIEVSANGLEKAFKKLDPKILACFGKGGLSFEEAELLAAISGYDFSPEKKFLVDAILSTDERAKVLYPRSIIEGVGTDQRKVVKEYSKPIAVLAGKNDIAINYAYVESEVVFANLWRKKIQYIDGAGHAAHLDKPSEFNSLLQSFLTNLHHSNCKKDQSQ